MLHSIAVLLTLVSQLILLAAGLYALALLLRMVLQWAEVNPFGWLVVNLRRLTEPLLRPFRFGFDARMVRFDFMPLIAAVFVVLYGFFASDVIRVVVVVLESMSQPAPLSVGRVLLWIAAIVIDVVYAMLLWRFLLPFLGFGYSSPSSRFVFTMTEPLLKPLRRLLPFAGPIDFTPTILVIVLGFVLQGVMMNL